MSAVEGSNAQKTPKLVEGTTKSPSWGHALEPSHGSVSILDAAMNPAQAGY
jgi:hypothetical protein